MLDSRQSNRREFLYKSATALAAFPALSIAAACKVSATEESAPMAEACEWCGAAEAPPNPSWRIRIAPEGEPGEPLVVSGTVFGFDGKAPAQGVLIYAYHTDDTGYYTTRGDETGNGRRHGRLRGWMKTGPDGRYEFRTVVPAPYPNRRDPAHIHMTVTAPGLAEYWVDSIWFEGDPHITPAQRARLPERGGFFPIVAPVRGGDGVLRATRDIRLESVKS